jgi:hypothetical protein
VYHTAKTVIDRLEDEGIHVPEKDRYYPWIWNKLNFYL